MQIPLSYAEVQTITANIVHLTEQQRARRKMTRHNREALERDWAETMNLDAFMDSAFHVKEQRPLRNGHFNAKQKIAYAQRAEIIKRIDGGANPDDLAKGFEVDRQFIVWIRNRARV